MFLLLEEHKQYASEMSSSLILKGAKIVNYIVNPEMHKTFQ